MTICPYVVQNQCVLSSFPQWWLAIASARPSSSRRRLLLAARGHLRSDRRPTSVLPGNRVSFVEQV